MPTQQQVAIAADDFDLSPFITVIRSTDPQVVGKTFDYVEGQLLALRRYSNIKRGIATSNFETETPAGFAAMLSAITEENNSVLVPGLFHGDDTGEQSDGQPFNLVTEAELSRLTGEPVGSPHFARILEINGERYAARLKRCISPSCWLLFDFDRGVPGMPAAWRDLPILEALEMYEPLLPGLRHAAKVLYKSSSARIVGPGRPAGQASHVWVKVNAPLKIETVMRHLQVNAVLQNLAFRSPRYSQSTGEVIGEQWRGLFDWSVLITGRLVFTSKPVLTQAAIDAGFSVEPAHVTTLPGNDLDITGIFNPTPETLADYQQATGTGLEFRDGSRDGASSSMSVHVSGILNYDTPITVRGAEDSFGHWLEGMTPGATLRCEAPFRDSVSEAAFIRCTATGQGFIHDIGVGETYMVDPVVVQQRSTENLADIGQALSRRLLGDAATERQNAATEQVIERNEAAAELPLIVVDKEQPHVAAAAIMPWLRNIEHHPLWSVGGYMVFVDGAKLINVDRADPRHKVPVLGTVKINHAHLLEMVPRVVNLQQYRGRNIIAAKPSNDILNILLNSPDMKDHLPVLRGVAGTPFMRADGSLCIEQGYDEATGIWLQTPLDITVPERPTKAQALEALDLLRDLLVEMHFAEQPEGNAVGINESVALAAMMGVVLRPSFEACPATIINGTAAGAGKSYFTKLLGTLATGKDPAMLSWPKRAEELDKLLDSLLFDGVSVIAFDNANGVKIGGQKICSVVSESEIAGRQLGVTHAIKLSTRSTSMIINGNRVEAREDFAARAMTMQLAPNVVIARGQRYTYDPLSEVRTDRAKYVQAILTIARSFRVHPDAPRLDRWAGFGEWSDTVRSALVWLGCPDPLRTTVEAVAQDDELVGVTALVRAAHAFRPDGSPWKVAEFVAYLTAHADLAQGIREALDPEDEHGLARFGSMLGYWLRDRAAGRVVELEGGRLVSVRRHRAGGSNVAKWQVIEIS